LKEDALASKFPTADFVARCLIVSAIVTDEFEYLKSCADRGQNLHTALGLRARYIAGLLIKRAGYYPNEEIGKMVGLGLRDPVPSQIHRWYSATNIAKAEKLLKAGVSRP
jgi:hypothetical protein